MSQNIQHTGVVEKIEPPLVYVRIVQHSACSGCHAKSMCSASEIKIKIIEIVDQTGQFKENEEVSICAHHTLGIQAVLLAFILPLVLTFAATFVGSYLTGDDLIGGVAGISVLIPYYYCIYMVRNKLKRKFVFTLLKIN